VATDPARLAILDPRDDDRQLRISWHPSKRIVVFSHWRHDVCIATTPVALRDVASVVGVLVGALDDASRQPAPPEATEAPTVRSVRRDVARLVRGWLRPRLAPVVSLGTLRARRREDDLPPA
jgi:hypothetical protein